jgi:hypothetical protein
LSGTVTLASNAVLNTVAGNDFFTGLVLTNYGTVNWTNASLLGGSGLNVSIYNYGLWNAQSDNTFAGGYNGGTSLFDNFGTFLKSGKTGATVLDGAVVFNNTGTVTVSSGTLQLSGGATLAGGNLNFGIASTSNFGMLNLPGSVALTGTLGVTFNGYTPQVGDSFPLITYGSKTGVFTAFNLPSGVNWQQSYGSTTYKLTIGLPLNFALAVGQPAWTASGFNLAISGPVGSNYTVFVTTNLAQNNWSPLTNFVSVFTSTPITDTGATKFGTNRFYRLYLH